MVIVTNFFVNIIISLIKVVYLILSFKIPVTLAVFANLVPYSLLNVLLVKCIMQ